MNQSINWTQWSRLEPAALDVCLLWWTTSRFWTRAAARVSPVGLQRTPPTLNMATIEVTAVQAKEVPATEAGIRIADFDFDLDKDGTVDAFEKKVMQAFKAADADNSGILTHAEMLGVMKDMANMNKSNSGLKKMLATAVAIIVMLIGAMLAVSIAAGEMVKESHVGATGEMRSTTGGVVAVDSVESFTDIYDTALLGTEDLSKIKSMTFFIDM